MIDNVRFTTRNRVTPSEYRKLLDRIQDNIIQSNAVGYRITTPFISYSQDRITYPKRNYGAIPTNAVREIEYNLIYQSFIWRSQSDEDITARSTDITFIDRVIARFPPLDRLNYQLEENTYESDEEIEFGLWIREDFYDESEFDQYE